VQQPPVLGQKQSSAVMGVMNLATEDIEEKSIPKSKRIGKQLQWKLFRDEYYSTAVDSNEWYLIKNPDGLQRLYEQCKRQSRLTYATVDNAKADLSKYICRPGEVPEKGAIPDGVLKNPHYVPDNLGNDVQIMNVYPGGHIEHENVDQSLFTTTINYTGHPAGPNNPQVIQNQPQIANDQNAPRATTDIYTEFLSQDILPPGTGLTTLNFN
jgi:hypothetical protein